MNNNKITQAEINTALKVLSLLEKIAYSKMTTEKAINYCNKVQTIENDIRHIDKLIEE